MKTKSIFIIFIFIAISLAMLSCGGGTSGTDGGQTLSLKGKVLDQNGKKLVDIEITALETGDRVVSDKEGSFELSTTDLVKSVSFLVSDGEHEVITSPLTIENKDGEIIKLNIRLNTSNFSVSIENLNINPLPAPDPTPAQLPTGSPNKPQDIPPQEELIFEGKVIQQDNLTIGGVKIKIGNIIDISDRKGNFKLIAKPDSKGNVILVLQIGNIVKSQILKGLPNNRSIVTFNIKVKLPADIASNPFDTNINSVKVGRVTIRVEGFRIRKI